jgi:hypothetical protein
MYLRGIVKKRWGFGVPDLKWDGEFNFSILGKTIGKGDVPEAVTKFSLATLNIFYI